jgi:plastocyanin
MVILAILLCILTASCGGGMSSAPTTPTTPSNPNAFTLTTSGVAPKELTVAPGTRVLFVNNDARRHDMTSDPHPDHLDCPPLNAVGVLNPGQQRESANLIEVRTCGFHDHDNPDNLAMTGRVIVR